MIKVWRTLKGNKIRLHWNWKPVIKAVYEYSTAFVYLSEVHAGVQNTSTVHYRTVENSTQSVRQSCQSSTLPSTLLYCSVLPCASTSTLSTAQSKVLHCTAPYNTRTCTVRCLFILVAVQQRRALALHVRDAAPQGPALDRRHGRPRRRGRRTGTRWAQQQYCTHAGPAPEWTGPHGHPHCTIASHISPSLVFTLHYIMFKYAGWMRNYCTVVYILILPISCLLLWMNRLVAPHLH